MQAGAALVVDNTFATPLLVRPLELGAHFSGSQPDQISGRARRRARRRRGDRIARTTRRCARLSRTIGPVLGPFESYLTMRGIKTFPLRMERQCANACRVAAWLAAHPRVERVYFPAIRSIPTRPTIRRLFPDGTLRRHGRALRFANAGRDEVFRFMDALQHGGARRLRWATSIP